MTVVKKSLRDFVVQPRLEDLRLTRVRNNHMRITKTWRGQAASKSITKDRKNENHETKSSEAACRNFVVVASIVAISIFDHPKFFARNEEITEQ